MDNCLFCKIIAGEIPSTKVYEDEYVYAFNDINPQAPVHVLIVPKTHIDSAKDFDEENSEIASHIFLAASKIAKQLNLNDGFRIVTNSGEFGCQTVHHIHFHLLSGRQLSAEMA